MLSPRTAAISPPRRRVIDTPPRVSGSSIARSAPRRDIVSPKRLDHEVKSLEEEILRWKLRGEWATRRIVAMEAAGTGSDPGALVRLEARLATGVPPSAKEMHDEVSFRIANAEADGRRIRDALAEATELKATQERAHRERVEALRRRRDQVRDRKFVAQSQLRVAEGAMTDDQMLADSQYKRYQARIESSRQESMKRHESHLKQLERRANERCSYFEKETDQLAESMKKLLREKQAELDRMTQLESGGLSKASALGSRMEAIEAADGEIQALQNRLDFLDVEANEALNATRIFEEETSKAHIITEQLDGRIHSVRDVIAREQTAAAVVQSLHKSVRTLQQRLADAARAQRLLPPTTTTGSLTLAQAKMGDLEELRDTTRMDLRQRNGDLARLSDDYNHVDKRLREALLEGELLNSKIMRERVGAGVTSMTERGITPVGAATLFSNGALNKPDYYRESPIRSPRQLS